MAAVTGVMLLRNHAWTQDFLARVYGEEGNVFVSHSFWEQASMHHVLHDDTTPVYVNGVREEGIGASAWQVARRHVQFVPQWWINRFVSSCA